ncbi:MAG: hypothetical protein IKM59_04465 [Oscillospiraceae bacterium]|nr:hypothetical protein [Oscillospiraceae bacterium]
MRKESFKALAKTIPMLLLMYMLAGGFFRWYQLKNELLYDGSLIEGAFIHRVLPLLSLTLAVGFGFILWGLDKLTTHRECFSRKAPAIGGQILAGCLLIGGNLAELILGQEPVSLYTKVSLALTQSVPYLGLVAGVCVILFALRSMKGAIPSPGLYMLVSVYLVVRLIVCFQAWNMDPSIHDYAYKLLAAIASMLGVFQIAGFGFGKGKRRMTAFLCLCGAFFCAVSVPDCFGKLPELLTNLALLILVLTHGMQLLFPPKAEAVGEPTAENPTREEASPELP